MFNARRDGEPARLTVHEWREAITGTWIDPNLIGRINVHKEKYLIDNLKLAYQAGKGSRKLLPILFLKDTLEPISKLLEERSTAMSQRKIFSYSQILASQSTMQVGITVSRL
ncbi:histone-lysine N-methyltransferase setd8-a [Plakobranchus ocellatus]|uniref:Histone-lysine N-methyltransferase setd8-a n=1 Tax=Plakobranchus ocellatus TaxID=259542 RepID=A0AAV4CBY4_9GAST|nr:histone-lysine N-methyltransferase setd8-a [Plakobranchus ocellatus]